MSAATLIRIARSLRWQLSWIADGGRNTGRTNGGETQWKQVPHSKKAIYVDVNTIACGFDDRKR
jgi:hypothetical protein